MSLERRRQRGAKRQERRATKRGAPPRSSYRLLRLDARSAFAAIKPPDVDRGDPEHATSPCEDVRLLRTFDPRPDRARGPALHPKCGSWRHGSGDRRRFALGVPPGPIVDAREDIPYDLDWS